MSIKKRFFVIFSLLAIFAVQPVVYGQKISPKKLKQFRRQRVEGIAQDVLQAGRAHTSNAAKHGRPWYAAAHPNGRFAFNRLSQIDTQKLQGLLEPQAHTRAATFKSLFCTRGY